MKNNFFLCITIIWGVLIFIIFGLYQYNSLKPKKIEIDTSNVEIIKEDCNVQDISKNKKKVTCVLDEKYIDEKEYYNYVIGKGTGIKINCTILLKTDDERTYKLKTLVEKNEDKKIYFTSCIKSKYLKDNYKIFIINNENNKIYEYIGENSENNI